MKATQKAWIAGFYEGEGYTGVTYQKTKGKAYSRGFLVTITQKEKTPLLYIQKLMKFGHIYENNGVYRWFCRSRYALKFLRTIRPFMKSPYKKQQMQKTLDIVKTMKLRSFAGLKQY